MSGHNRWSTIKHKKAIADAKKSRGWTKLLKEVTVAARGGSDPAGNARLRAAIEKARASNIPNDTIERAVKKGSGELAADQLEELTYQAYGPGGVAIVIELATDNRNRTASELRKLLEKQNAKIDTSGSVMHKFRRRGQLIFDAARHSEDAITEAALELGAEDVRAEGDTILVLTEAHDFHQVKEAFEKRGLVPESGEVALVPEQTVTVGEHDAEVITRLLEALDDHDDVLNVYANFEVASGAAQSS